LTNKAIEANEAKANEAEDANEAIGINKAKAN
jgi:hypothetical protein